VAETVLVAAGHQPRAGRAAVRPGDVAVTEAHAVLGERIDVRRRDVLAALEADVGVAQVVGQQDDDVGLLRLALRAGRLSAGQGEFAVLANDQVPNLPGPLVLEAISCGAVFFGAMTYIGNGPNFMVQAIAEEAGFRPPSFFGYLGYACVVLLPVFAVVTALFFVSP